MARRLNEQRPSEPGGPEWFAPKRYGYGAGFPIAWQGWALLIVYVAILIAAGLVFGDRPVVVIAIALPVTVLLILIAARTTRGGWRWRWGKKS